MSGSPGTSVRPRSVVVLGAGGHGKVVADILLRAGRTVLGFLDSKKPPSTVVLGLPVLGDESWVVSNPDAEVALGIGDNSLRERLAISLVEQGVALASAVHPSAVVAPSARIDDGVVIAALAVVNPDATVARGALINTGAIVEHDNIIGAFAHLATNVTTGGGCAVGRKVLVGSGSTLRPYTSVGDESIVGSHSLVTRDIPARTVAYGVPASVRREAP